jgi:uncharacterized protein YutE (UPF0331/DUF86 family)
MTPGSVDLKIVRDRLLLVEQSLEDLRSLPQTDVDEFTSDRRNILAADAALRRGLEALFDVTRHLLAKGVGVGSLEYREVAQRACDHGLVGDLSLAARFVEMAGYRNRLTHHYDEVTPAELFAVISQRLGDLEAVADALRTAAARLAGPPE